MSTPWSALAGGVVIGVAAAMLVLLNGRIAGVAGIIGRTWDSLRLWMK